MYETNLEQFLFTIRDKLDDAYDMLSSDQFSELLLRLRELLDKYERM